MDEMPGDLFDEWMVFAQMEPFGGMQEDRRAGMLCMILHAVNRPKGSPKLGPGDFFPSLVAEQPATDWELRRLEWRALAEAQRAIALAAC